MNTQAIRILLVDDDLPLRDMLARSLQQSGFMVVQAVSGEVALALISVTQAPFDLLIADVHMPGMKGPELARRVRRIHPDIDVLLISADQTQDTRGAESRFLAKPFTPTELLGRVDEILKARLSRNLI